ncbi:MULTISPECIES: hypothetical protein [Chroococcidiopsis]|uniref:hypothetical protein n=1 Tax=Chroococcidiopsis TaxID=54298 RepID=UPI0003007032|nr:MULTISPECIES: hypothetical protein [Chroococcidiopsis]
MSSCIIKFWIGSVTLGFVTLALPNNVLDRRALTQNNSCRMMVRDRGRRSYSQSSFQLGKTHALYGRTAVRPYKCHSQTAINYTERTRR